MTNITMTPIISDHLLTPWLQDLQTNDRARGTIRRYKSAVESFWAWYEQQEHRPLTLEQLSPITLVVFVSRIIAAC